MKTSRQKAVDAMRKWIGLNVADGSYQLILDTYNSIKPLPRGVKMQKGMSWCAATQSALFHSLGYDKIFPLECSCGKQIEKAIDMGIWVEDDKYVPLPGDTIMYDWDDSKKDFQNTDNTGWPDHTGMVLEVFKSQRTFTVAEGNNSKSVKIRTMSFNGQYIRGFIVPKYDDNTVSTSVKLPYTPSLDDVAHEVIAGKYGNGDTRKKNLEKLGFDPDEVQKRVNQILNIPDTITAAQMNAQMVKASTAPMSSKSSFKGNYKTTAALYCRDGAGTNKKALCCIPKGTKVSCDGQFTKINGVNWLYVQATLKGITYIGFSSSSYLTKV